MSDGFNWLITVTGSNNWESLQLAYAFIQLLLLDFKSVPSHRWLRCLKELSIQLIASNNKRNNAIPPFTRVVASTITIQGVQDKEKRKLLTDYQGEPRPFVALFPDSTFVVFWEFANSKITPDIGTIIYDVPLAPITRRCHFPGVCSTPVWKIAALIFWNSGFFLNVVSCNK